MNLNFRIVYKNETGGRISDITIKVLYQYGVFAVTDKVFISEDEIFI